MGLYFAMSVLIGLFGPGAQASRERELRLRPGPFPPIVGAELGQPVNFENEIDIHPCFPVLLNGEVVSWIHRAHATSTLVVVQRCVEFDPGVQQTPGNSHGGVNESWDRVIAGSGDDRLRFSSATPRDWRRFANPSFCGPFVGLNDFQNGSSMLLNAYRAAAGLGLVLAAAHAVVPPSRVPVSGGGMEAGSELLAPGAQGPDSRLVTSSSMGPVRLRMTLGAVRQLVPTASIERVSDGDGAALVRVAFGLDDSLILSADEEDPDVPIDWSRRITTIETFSHTFHTVEGVRPGSLVEDVIKVFGPVREIVVSEIESREFITFENQPSWLTFRLDYTGVFPAGVKRTRQFKPGAKILGILISHSGDHLPARFASRSARPVIWVAVLQSMMCLARTAVVALGG